MLNALFFVEECLGSGTIGDLDAVGHELEIIISVLSERFDIIFDLVRWHHVFSCAESS